MNTCCGGMTKGAVLPSGRLMRSTACVLLRGMFSVQEAKLDVRSAKSLGFVGPS